MSGSFGYFSMISIQLYIIYILRKHLKVARQQNSINGIWLAGRQWTTSVCGHGFGRAQWHFQMHLSVQMYGPM